MAGSHRGDAPRAGRRPLSVAAGVLAGLLVAGAFAFVRLSGDDAPGGDSGPDAGTPTGSPTSAPSVTPTATPPATSTPTASPSAPPALPTLAPASPRRLVVAGLVDAGFDDAIEPDGDRFTTRSTAELSRWGSRAVPASPAEDTVFVAGRIAPDGDSGFGALPRVGRGARIDLRTDAGTLTYTVRAVATRTATGITDSPLFTARVPGRLVLIGIRYDDRGATDTYVVVTADLTAVRRD